MTTQMITLTIICMVLAATAAVFFAMANIHYEKSKELRKEADAKQANCLEVRFSPLRYGIEKTDSHFDVFAEYQSVDGKRVARILIKRFDVDDDRDFALLEAQELLEHLNEK